MRLTTRVFLAVFVMVCLAQCGFSVSDSLVIYEVDGKLQQDRPTTVSRIFERGEILNCPEPFINGNASSVYQADIKNRWPDGSVRFAIVSFIETLPSQAANTITFRDTQNCNNVGFISSAPSRNFDNFNGGRWSAQMEVTSAGNADTEVVDAKKILRSDPPDQNSFGDCKNNYWLKGPVVTAVIVQDCTPASRFDFGWQWTSAAMLANRGEPFTGNSKFASFHPMFVLYFYPSIHAVLVEFILENDWSTRSQDQLADIVFRTDVGSLGSHWSHVGARILNDITATTVSGKTQIMSQTANFGEGDIGLPIDVCGNSCASGNYYFTTIDKVLSSTTAVLARDLHSSGTGLKTFINLQIASTRHRKVLWSGAEPGHIRIDHNFRYLISTMGFPNYDASVSVSPESVCVSCTSYSEFVKSDKGDIGGIGGIASWSPDYSDNSEGAPIQREELQYLYNMHSCGVANGACAKAYQELTGESGLIDDKLLSGNVLGGGGVWNNLGNVPFHYRESQTTATGQQQGSNYYYCPGFNDKNARNDSTACNGSGELNVATGRAQSRHVHSDQNMEKSAVGSGTSPPGGWSIGNPGCDHWLDFAYTPYLLTGDYYFLEEEYQSAAFCLGARTPDTAPWQSNRFFGFVNSGSVIRELAWALQTIARAAFIAPDDSLEAHYYHSMLDSNLEVEEGFLDITGTHLTPKHMNPNCTNYDNASTNRWDFGRCSVASQCSGKTCVSTHVTLHQVAIGLCPYEDGDLQQRLAGSVYSPWMYNFLSIVLSELREMGYSEAEPVSKQTYELLEEKMSDSTFNPFLIGAYLEAATWGDSASKCNLQNPFISSYSQLKSAYVPSMQNLNRLDVNESCTDHGYALVARAAASFLQEFLPYSLDANCPGGRCTAAAAWIWLDTHVPYFDKAALPKGQNCVQLKGRSAGDEQIKFALVPR